MPNTEPDEPERYTVSQLFFHSQYHPKSLLRAFIQQTYKDTCNKEDHRGESFSNAANEEKGSTMVISKLTVAYSRPKNLRDILSPSKLREFNGCRVENFLDNY